MKRKLKFYYRDLEQHDSVLQYFLIYNQQYIQMQLLYIYEEIDQ